MNKRKQSLRNKIVILVAILFVFLTVGAIYIANEAYALPTGITIQENKEKENERSSIVFSNIDDSSTIDFTVDASKGLDTEIYSLSVSYKIKEKSLAVANSKIKLLLQSSLDNKTYKDIKEIEVTDTKEEKTIIDKELLTDKLVYYRIVLYIDDVIQDVRNNNIAFDIITKLYTKYDFEQMDNSQEWTADQTGDYRIELWGASGNSYGNQQKVNSGKGAYTAGTIHLEEGTKLYVNVGKNATSGTAWYQESYGGGGALNKVI